MKKLLYLMLAIIGLALIPPAYAQNFSVSLRNWDLLVFMVEAEYHPMPHLGIVAGVGPGVVGGVSYFAQPDHTGYYGSSRLFYTFSTGALGNPGVTSFLALFNTVGYRWMPSQNIQLDLEMGLLWPVLLDEYNYNVRSLPLISFGFGYRF